MKKILTAFLMLILIGSFLRAAYADDVKLVASVNSDRYHRIECKVAQKIRPEDIAPNLVTPEDFIAAGYVPCKKCNPPMKSKK